MSADLTRAWVRRWTEAVLEKRSGVFFSLFRLCCRIVSAPVFLITILRRWLYRTGLLRTHAVPARVISVGNITIGGTGKTPLVALLAECLHAGGARPVILSRGYGRASAEMVFLPDDAAGWEQAGDEPLMISTALPAVPIAVSADRVAAARAAWDRFHPQVFILDDGMQHVRMRRDLEIVVIDASRPLEGERIFPAGRLREGFSALRRADLFFLTRTGRSGDIEALSVLLTRYQPGAPQVHSVFRPWALEELPGGPERPLKSLDGYPVLAVSGIGNPEALERSLNRLGARLAGRMRFPDHHPYTGRDVDLIERRARDLNARAVVTTEKDAVRLRRIGTRSVPFLVLKVRIEITSGEEDFWRIVTGGN